MRNKMFSWSPWIAWTTVHADATIEQNLSIQVQTGRFTISDGIRANKQGIFWHSMIACQLLGNPAGRYSEYKSVIFLLFLDKRQRQRQRQQQRLSLLDAFCAVFPRPQTFNVNLGSLREICWFYSRTTSPMDELWP